MSNQEDHSKSLNKYISETGICSRREADKWIESGRVKINGRVAQKGNRVGPGDKVLLDNKPIGKKNKRDIYIAYNKPVGIVSTTDLREKKNIIHAVNHKERIFPIGRLDKASQGLILLTNNGDIVNKILRSENQHEKEYIVTVNKAITSQFLQRMASGIPILGTKTKRCKVSKINEKTFRIILTQGLNRQIRRMCEFLGYGVAGLKRVRIMHIPLGTLKVGKWRNLSKEEVEKLHKLTRKNS